VSGCLLIWAGGLAVEDHLAVQDSALEEQQKTTGIDPGLMPPLPRSVVDVEALATVSAARLVALVKDAAADLPLDAVGSRELAACGVDVPFSNPEVELPMPGRRARSWLTLGGRRCGYAEARACVARRRGSGWAQGEASFLSKFFSEYELQARPDLADRANLDIHQAEGQRDRSDRVLRDVSRNLRGLLRP
jgi:hypothetical protein